MFDTTGKSSAIPHDPFYHCWYPNAEIRNAMIADCMSLPASARATCLKSVNMSGPVREADHRDDRRDHRQETERLDCRPTDPPHGGVRMLEGRHLRGSLAHVPRGGVCRDPRRPR